LSRDGQLLATAAETDNTESVTIHRLADSTNHVHKFDDLDEKATLWSIVISPDAHHLLTCWRIGEDEEAPRKRGKFLDIRVTNASTNRQVCKFHIDGHLDFVPAFSTNGKEILLASANRLRWIETETGKIRRDISVNGLLTDEVVRGDQIGVEVKEDHDEETSHFWLGIRPLDSGFVLSPDAKLLATRNRDETTIRLWDTMTGKRVGEIATPAEHGVAKLFFSPDGRRLATIGGDTTILVWPVPGR
jgi:WD40 repeat protein